MYKILILTWNLNTEHCPTRLAAVGGQPGIVTRVTSLLSNVPLTALPVNLGGIHTGSRSVPCRGLRGEGTDREVERGRGRNEGPVGAGVTAVGQDAGVVHHVTVKVLTAQHSVSVLTTYNVTNKSRHKPHVTAKKG